MTIVLALFASLFIGISDFLGGTVSRTRSPLETSLVLFLAALVTLVPIAILLGASDLTVHDLGLGAVSGLTTSVAYVGFFAAIGHGRISIVAPISAAVTALLPAIAGIAGGNTLSTLARWGVLCALLAIPLVAYETEDGDAERRLVHWPAGARVDPLRGRLWVLLHLHRTHTSQRGTVADGGHPRSWGSRSSFPSPLAATRCPRSPPYRASPSRAAWRWASPTPALTTALQRGPLTVASVLGNLYPLVTIALGVSILGERVRLWHAAGILLAVAGVAMIAAGQ